MTPTEAGVREYCANTRENVNLRIGFKFLLAQVVENSEASEEDSYTSYSQQHTKCKRSC